jgi:hypothetical protein
VTVLRVPIEGVAAVVAVVDGREVVAVGVRGGAAVCVVACVLADDWLSRVQVEAFEERLCEMGCVGMVGVEGVPAYSSARSHLLPASKTVRFGEARARASLRNVGSELNEFREETS